MEEIVLHRGHTPIYEWSRSSWVELGVGIDGEASVNFSGIAVSMNSIGDKLAIGAHRNNGNGRYSGHLRVFENNRSTNIAIVEKNPRILIYPNPASEN